MAPLTINSNHLYPNYSENINLKQDICDLEPLGTDFSFGSNNGEGEDINDSSQEEEIIGNLEINLKEKKPSDVILISSTGDCT
jgi:hypothetical protein